MTKVMEQAGQPYELQEQFFTFLQVLSAKGLLTKLKEVKPIILV